MRIVKTRLCEMIPDVRIFLDLDDLEIGVGAEYVDRSSMILTFLTDGYCESKNCMRELLRAVHNKMPILVLTEQAAKQGALTMDQISQQLVHCEASAQYAKWFAASARSNCPPYTPAHLPLSGSLNDGLGATLVAAE